MRIVVIILFLAFSFDLRAQEHTYRQYTTADGLPSNVVYGAFQDQRGFIWFCTNAGVSRFNGISFQNFTVEHGLSDNEVFGAFTTGSGKIWFKTFNSKLCYYENDTFHNAKTDPWLDTIFRGLRLPYVDAQGRAWSREYTDMNLYELNERNRAITRRASRIGDRSIVVSPGFMDTVPAAELSLISDRMDEFASKNKAIIDRMPDMLSYFMFVRSFLHTLNKEYPSFPIYYLYIVFAGRNASSRFRLNDLIFDPENDSSYWVAHANKGIIRGTNIHNLQERPDVYLANRNINNVLVDREGNYWFTSPTEGVFFLNAHGVKTFDAGQDASEIYSVTGNSRYIIWGKDNEVMFINRHTREKSNWQYNVTQNGAAYNRIKDMMADGDNHCWIASDIGLVCIRFSGNKAERVFPASPASYALHLGAMKAITKGSDGNIYVGSHVALIAIDPSRTVTFLDALRITAIVEKEKGHLLVGSTTGLHEYRTGGRISRYRTKNTEIKQHITDLQKASGGFICAATNDLGLIVMKDDQFFNILASDSAKRLTSNICRKLFIDSADNIWACTNKGLCKVTIKSWQPFAYDVRQFTTDDGLISNDVNDVFVSGDTVWVATSGGLSYFRQADVMEDGAVPLIYISRADTLKDRSFPYRSKIAIGLEGLSYESLGKLRYYYRLKGLFDDWRYTDRNQLLYDILPAGQYQLEVYSINRFGQRSASPEVVVFTIVPPWWATNWAYALYFIALIGMLAAAFALVRRNSRRKERARMKHIQQLQQLELKALRSQMNPHFIFNTLNAVQKYILENDKEASYRYLTRFSKLIRSFLENSRQTSISLKDELDLLRAYMEMEALRFRNKFTYEIELDPALDPVSVYIPSMLIQPYVENAIWHGIQHKETNGFVKLSVQDLGGNVLKCRIQDNGIGRKRAGEIESASGSQHQPVGMTITQQRLEIINERLKQVSVNFIDIGEEMPGQGTGTIVELVVTYLTKKP